MKLKPESRNIDLYVSEKQMTEKERQELIVFIEQLKLQQTKKARAKKAA